MAISTIAGVIAGMQPPQFFYKNQSGAGIVGKPYSTWGMTGIPAQGSYDTTLNGVTLSSSSVIPPGAIPHYDPTSGNAYLARLNAAVNQGGLLILCDRLWHNGGINATITTAQTIVSPTFPARDANGGTAGVGVYLGLEISAAMGANTPTISVGYTNSSGVSGRTGANLDTTNATAIANTFYRIGVQTTDLGVQSVQSLTFGGTAWASGTCNLVAYRVLSMMEIAATGLSNAIDPLIGGLPQLSNGVVPFMLFVSGGTSQSNIVGGYNETQG